MKQLGHGTTFSWNSQVVAELTKIGTIELSADMIDVTTHQSTDYFKEKMPGMIDPGEVPIEGYFDPTDTNGQASMLADMISRTSRAFAITFPSATGTSWSGNAYVSKIKPAGEADSTGMIPFTASLAVTGKPTFAIAASAGLTTPFFAISNSAVITPAPANDQYTYVATVLTGVSSVTVTPTATAGAITVNGTTVATGQASGAIALGAAGSVTTITIKVTETNKSPKTYTIYLSRAAS